MSHIPAGMVSALLLCIPLGCSHAEDAVLHPGGPVIITAVGPVGTSDDSQVFQAAADLAERSRAPLVLPPGTTINLRGNVYLGSLTLQAAGTTINCLYDAGFHPRGTASLRTEGCVLTKSASQAGYGLRTVSIHFDTLTVNTIRSVPGTGARIGLLLENTDQFVGARLNGTAQGTGVGEVTPFDFRRGVQGVRIDRVVGHMKNRAGPGGFWIRNDSPERATAGIEIGSVEMDGATGDELLAVFNSRVANADLHDIHIGRAALYVDGGCGQGLAIFRNVGDYDPSRMQRIAIDRIDVEIARIGPELSRSPGVFAVKVQRVDAQLGPVAITYSGPWTPNLPHVLGLRFAPGMTQTKPLHVPSVTVTVKSSNAIPRGIAAMVWGPVEVDDLVIRGAGSGFRQIAVGAQNLRNVDAETASSFADPFMNSTRVRGRLNGQSVDR